MFRELAAGSRHSCLTCDFNYQFSVIVNDRSGPSHEPLAFPSGYIVVPASLILTARNEVEFAGMLAHAMAHIAEGHGFRPAPRGGEMPMWFVGGGGQETEADAPAVKMLSGAGYDPEALARYIGRTQIGSRESRTVGMQNAIRQLAVKAYTDGSADEFVYAQDEVRRAVQ